MLIFNLTVQHIWGRVLAKFQGGRTVAYADDGYIKGNLSVVLQVLTVTQRIYFVPHPTTTGPPCQLLCFDRRSWGRVLQQKGQRTMFTREQLTLIPIIQ